MSSNHKPQTINLQLVLDNNGNPLEYFLLHYSLLFAKACSPHGTAAMHAVLLLQIHHCGHLAKINSHGMFINQAG